MLKKLLSTPNSYLLFSILIIITSFGQGTIRFKVHRASEQQDAILKQQFKTYTLATLSTESVSNLLRSKDYFNELQLTIGEETYSFNLKPRDLRAPHYKLRSMTDAGVVEWPRSPNKTFAGYTLSGHYDVRITSDDDFFYGLIIQLKYELIIEPMRDIIPGTDRNQFVIYWASDHLKKLTQDACGTLDGLTHSHDPFEESNETPEHESSNRACKVVQIALADDHLMFNQYGSVPEVEEHNMAVINNVETNYDNEFDDDIEFTVVEIFVATSSGNDPWPTGNDPYILLDEFTDWGPSGFDNTHDVASLWSGRNFTGDVIGVAWLSAVCTGFRYNVLEDFSNNANLLRCLQAHEMGHNFSADHDAPNSGFIMAPSVSNTNTWSSASINSINNFIDNINCLGPCSAPIPPVAAFDADPTEGCAPLVVHFDDESQNTPTSWAWTFEGGTPGTSTLQNPNVTYNNPGSFNVTLIATNAQGSNSKTEFDFITVGEEAFADFDYFINEFEVDFENQSEFATSYFWNFGDGGTSTQTNPLHEYAEDGEYTVTLTATNSCGSDVFTQTIEIITLPIADFDASITEGCDPFEVEFYNFSSDNADDFFWSFPGGSPPTSTLFEPTIVYETPGTYNVTLTVYNEAGQDALTYNSYILVIPQPAAEFSFTTNGLQVNFNSLGSNGDDFFWTFGDGGTSTLVNPSHTYPQTGVYQVSLTVSNDCGSENLTLNVSVTGAPMAAFSSNTQSGCAPLVVQFTNQSGGNPTSYNWVFQGGSPATSALANPIVTYNSPGVYDVTLTVTNSTGSDVQFNDNYIEVEFPTTSDFDFSVNGLQALFFNQSNNATGSTWYFGDGLVSDDTNPIHVYNQDGVYTVTLVSEGLCGNDTSTAQVTIQTPPQAEFSFQQMSACVPANVVFTNESSSNATAFAWSFPGGVPSTSNLENPTVTYNNPGIYNVTLIAFSAAGSDTMTWPSFVNIGSTPDAAFLLSTSETTVTLDNQTSDATVYLWIFGDGQTSTEQNPSHTYPSFGTYILSLIATNSCGNDTMEVVIELSTIPNAFFSYSTHTGCAPFEIQFIDQSQNNPTSWEWTFEGGTPPTSTEQNPIVQYTVPGDYSVSLRVENSQGTDALVLDGLINVGGMPDASFTHIQNENSVSLEYPGLDYDSLRWYFGDGRTDNSVNPTVVYTTSGQYQISLIVYNPCGSDTSSVWVTINITATHEVQANLAGWMIKPNPFKDVLIISGTPTSNGKVRLSLVDMQGQLISSEEWEYTAGQVTKEIHADQLPSGVILVWIQDELSRVILKAVHQ